MHRAQGFTLLEILLALSVLFLLTAASVPLYQQLQSNYDLDQAAQLTVTAARSAQRFAKSSRLDSSWGIFTQQGSVTLFKGSSYAARDVAHDDVFTLSTGLVISGTTEYVFQKINGVPSQSGTTSYTNALQQSKTITINDAAILY